jgi:hypothetical protein
MDEPARELLILEAIRRVFATVDPERRHRALRFAPLAILPYFDGLVADESETPSEREVDLVLRMLLPGTEPRFEDGSWTLEHDCVDVLLLPRQAALVDRPFERLHALVMRLEARTRRLIRLTDQRLDQLGTAIAAADRSEVLALASESAALDRFLRETLYHHHLAERRLSEARGVLGRVLQARLSDPTAPLEDALLEPWIAELSKLDDELDRAQEVLAGFPLPVSD